MSDRQRRQEIKTARTKLDAKKAAPAKMQERRIRPVFGPRVNEQLLAPYNSYGVPDFVRRGYYLDVPFRCIDCGKADVWTGSQQKWWRSR